MKGFKKLANYKILNYFSKCFAHTLVILQNLMSQLGKAQDELHMHGS